MPEITIISPAADIIVRHQFAGSRYADQFTGCLGCDFQTLGGPGSEAAWAEHVAELIRSSNA